MDYRDIYKTDERLAPLSRPEKLNARSATTSAVRSWMRCARPSATSGSA